MVETTEYRIEHEIMYSETDGHDRFSIPAIFALFQEGAIRHAEQLGFGREYCADTGRVWVLSRCRLEIKSYPMHRDRIFIETWPKGTNGPYALRDFVIEDEDGTQVVLGTSSWLLLENETGRPVRIQQVTDQFPKNGSREAIPGPAPKASKRGISGHGHPVRVGYADLDHNRHVNNVQYVRWCLDCFNPASLEGIEIGMFTINYAKAAEWGDELSVYYESSRQKAHVLGRFHNGADCFSAEIRLRPSSH